MSSELEIVRQRLHVLALVSERLASSLDDTTTLPDAASALVPAVADACLIDVEQDGRLTRAVVTLAAPAKAHLAEALATRYLPDPERPNPALPALRAGRSLLSARIDDAWCRVRALDEGHFAVLRALELRSVLSVPLRHRDEFLGVLSLATTRDSERRYGADDVEFVEDLGRRIAGALLKARLYREAQHARAVAEAARAEAEAANRAKDEFLAVLSHELRSPLQGMLGWVTLLRRGALDAAGAERALRAIDRGMRAQAQLVNDLLEVSRIVSGKLALVEAPVAVHELVETAIDQILPVAQEKGVQVVRRTEGCGSVFGDAERLHQVFTNLLTNAVKFTPAGGVVEVHCAREGAEAVIAVRDTGEGIAPEFLPHLFDRFSQASPVRTRHHGGLGLGLSIVRHLVERHGGSVQVQSPGVGQGATFTVRLPLRPEA